jgi:polyphosphate glucokinase
MILGIDIGGSGIKGAPVDLDTGAFAQERVRVVTPQPSTPKHVVKAVGEVVDQFDDADRIGIAFPAVVVNGVTRTAANVDPMWIGANAAEMFSDGLGRPVTVLNDADAAGTAEVAYGAGKNRPGLTIVLTFGTGIGSALFLDGRLVPNTELGHLQIRDKDAELRASDRAREADGLTWEKWASRVEEYLQWLERLLWPDLIILGGGVSRKADKFLPLIHLDTPLVPAALQNDAGIIGAALAASLARPTAGARTVRTGHHGRT